MNPRSKRRSKAPASSPSESYATIIPVLFSFLATVSVIVYSLNQELGFIDHIPWISDYKHKNKSNSEEPSGFYTLFNDKLQEPREKLQKFREELASFMTEYERLQIRCQVLDGVENETGEYRNFPLGLPTIDEIAEDMRKTKSELIEREESQSEEISQAEKLLEELDKGMYSDEEFAKKHKELDVRIEKANKWYDWFDLHRFLDPDYDILTLWNQRINAAKERIFEEDAFVFSLESLKFIVPESIGMNRFCKPFDVLVDDLASITSPSLDSELFRENLLEQIAKDDDSQTELENRAFALYSDKEELRDGFYICFVNSEWNTSAFRLTGKVMKFACRFDENGADGTFPVFEKVEEFSKVEEAEAKSVFAFVFQESARDDTRRLEGIVEMSLPDKARDALVGKMTSEGRQPLAANETLKNIESTHGR